METTRRQHRVVHFLLKAARAVGLRVLLWGGVALAIALWFGYVRLPVFLLQPWSATSPESIGDAAEGLGWPHLRGPAFNATSAESGLADSWPAEGPPVLWVKEIGAGYSGFCALGDRVWTQRQTLYAQSVLCRRCDLAMMWLFLVGLLPSWPLTIPVACRSAAVARPFREMLWAAFAFSVYYWMSAAYAWWYLGG